LGNGIQDDILPLVMQIDVGKPDHQKSVASQPLVPTLIMTIGWSVVRAVQLDDQSV
jgi:hypothetical protein